MANFVGPDERFVYTPLAPGEVRILKVQPESHLLDIKCSVEHKSLAEIDDQYVAISYCWRDPTPVVDITLNGKKIGVAYSLLGFLIRILMSRWTGEDETGHFYRVDALCINQADLKEKSEQVQGMWKVYESAAFVYAWLGGNEDYTTLAFRTLADLPDLEAQMKRDCDRHWQNEIAPLHFGQLSHDARNAVTALANNGYFEPMWVLQEVVCAKHVVLVSGLHHIPLDAFKVWSRLLSYGDKRRMRYKPAIYLESLIEQRESTRGSHSEMTRPAARVLEKMLQRHCDRKCTDVRDHAFALLGLPLFRQFESDVELKADYSMTINEVVAMVLSYWSHLQSRGRDLKFTPGQPRRPSALEHPLSPRLDVLHIARLINDSFGVKCLSASYRRWLRSVTIRHWSSGDLSTITLASKREIISEGGTKIRCSSRLLPDLLDNRMEPRNIAMSMPQQLLKMGLIDVADMPKRLPVKVIKVRR